VRGAVQPSGPELPPFALGNCVHGVLERSPAEAIGGLGACIRGSGPIWTLQTLPVAIETARRESTQQEAALAVK